MFIKIHNIMLDTFSSRKPSTIMAVSIFLLLTLGILDYFTGDYSLIVFYLIPVSLVAWFVSKRNGLFFCCITLLLRFVADEAPSSFAFHNATLHYWNEAIEFLFLVIMSLLFSALHKNLLSEQTLASTDPLTGLLNRRSFFNLAEYELNRSRRYSQSFTIAYIDLDNFKEINDSLGHHTGDELLVTVTQIMAGNIRSTDILARFGGDEFVLLLPETSSNSAVLLLKKIHHIMQESMDKHGWKVTFSIGAVTYLKSPSNVDDVIRRADAQMYTVKHSGKNNLLHNEITEID